MQKVQVALGLLVDTISAYGMKVNLSKGKSEVAFFLCGPGAPAVRRDMFVGGLMSFRLQALGDLGLR